MAPVGARLDRRAFLAAGAAVALGSRWVRVADALAAVDPRLRALARVVSGPVLSPADAAYAQARLVYNERYDDVRPLGVVQPVSVADVRAIVAWSHRTGVPLAIRSGGHSYAGYSTGTGLVVDLKRLAAIHLDASGMATIGAGARLVDVEAILASHGRAVPAGSCATVGIGGLALGGGVGLASRAFGTTSDNVVSLGIVTADGRHRNCSAHREPRPVLGLPRRRRRELRHRHALRPPHAPGLERLVLLRRLAVVAGREVVRAWQAFAPHAPDGLFSICALQTGGSGGPSLRSFGQYLGSETALRSVLRPLTNVAGVRLTTGSSSYFDAQLRWAGCLGKTVAQCHIAGEAPGGTLQRASFAGKSDYVNAPLSAGAIGTISSWIEQRAAQRLRLGRAAPRLVRRRAQPPRPEATAFVHRDALCSAQYLAYWYTPSHESRALTWIRGFYAAMRPHVSGFAYQNYIDRDLASWRHAYYGRNYARLRAVKAAVDPHRLFRFPQAIEN